VTSDAVAACGVALQAQRYLLVLDDCDRVTGAVADLVQDLLAQADPLTVLATSRSPLGGPDEALFEVRPLPVGESGEEPPAVRLFLDRVRSAAPAAHLEGVDAGLVARLCRRLDGLPLALELAAARSRSLPVRELAARLDRGLEVLDRAGPTGRHRSLAAAVEWTWDLLDAAEREVLGRLAALPGSFDLATAERVTWPGAGGVVLRLLDRSLVSSAPAAAGPTRFRLLAPVRAVVLDRTGPAVAREVRTVHAVHPAAPATRPTGRTRTEDGHAALGATMATHGSPGEAVPLPAARDTGRRPPTRRPR
jgi:predicted ATPase